MITPADKRWIDDSTYANLLYRWRYGPVGDNIFQRDTGDYYSKVMAEKKKTCSDPVQVSKDIDRRHDEAS